VVVTGTVRSSEPVASLSVTVDGIDALVAPDGTFVASATIGPGRSPSSPPTIRADDDTASLLHDHRGPARAVVRERTSPRRG
jgi:hypothetical protein